MASRTAQSITRLRESASTLRCRPHTTTRRYTLTRLAARSSHFAKRWSDNIRDTSSRANKPPHSQTCQNHIPDPPLRIEGKGLVGVTSDAEPHMPVERV